MGERSEWHEKLDGILTAHVSQPSPLHLHMDDTKDMLIGASFMLVNKEGILFSGSSGRTSLGGSLEPWTIHTFAWMASLTKLPSTVCLLQLLSRGYLTLDEDLRSRFRETVVAHLASVQILRGFDATDQAILEPNVRPITLRHLLTHTSGLGYDLPSENLMRWRRSVGKLKNNLSWTGEGFSTPLLFEPGTAWLYGTGIDWATRLLEAVTGETLREYMDANIFKPLGIRNSVFRPGTMPGCREGKTPIPQPAKILFREPDRTLHEMKPQPISSRGDHELDSGGAGLFSTTYEYSKLLRGILGGELLPKDSIELLFAPQLDDRLQKSMMETLAISPAFAPNYPPKMPANFAFGGMMNLEDIPGRRKAGSITWSGMSNCRWWIDRTTGIAGLLVVSVLPYGDTVASKLFDELERAVYEELQA
ncbi:hypothetical protein VPNG_10039 [Cytospora leucostoma]|uniref:Beta-lactamase-related domain-containing protein n=1 Tax=Cytospora leucostoma TaxID=1230097 RepID=A0A423VI04_9PEZI|nr:hypothetical protein VPNG_10039 [Cytospora leucostoma]